MEMKGAKLIQSWNQELVSRNGDYPHGMCLLFAFHFGARRMLHMNNELAMQETIQLEKPEGALVLRVFKDIFCKYLAGHGNFNDEVLNIARQYELYQIAAPLRFQVRDDNHFDITNRVGAKGLHLIAAEAILYHYHEQLHSNGFLMIGFKTNDGSHHALSLAMTLDDQFIVFDPNYGWYLVNHMIEFINNYGELANVIEWDFVFVKQE